MAAMEAAFSVFSSFYPPTSIKFPSCPRISQPATLPMGNCCSLHPSLKSSPHPFALLRVERVIRRPSFHVFSAVGEVALEEKTEKSKETHQRRKLFVLNLPWSFSVADIKNLFGECGTVVDVEIIKHKDGKNRGFAFVTMASGEEAQAAVDKFDSHELSGRVIRVEFAKKFKKPSRSPPANPSRGETHHKLYISNLSWKVRSSHLRDFFSAFNPVSARVVFASPSGRSAGYGFVSFATKEEADTALSALDGKELLSRPIRLKFSEKNPGESSDVEDQKNSGESPGEKDQKTEEQPENS